MFLFLWFVFFFVLGFSIAILMVRHSLKKKGLFEEFIREKHDD